MMPSEIAIQKEMEETGFSYIICCRRIRDRAIAKRKGLDRPRAQWG